MISLSGGGVSRPLPPSPLRMTRDSMDSAHANASVSEAPPPAPPPPPAGAASSAAASSTPSSNAPAPACGASVDGAPLESEKFASCHQCKTGKSTKSSESRDTSLSSQSSEEEGPGFERRCVAESEMR